MPITNPKARRAIRAYQAYKQGVISGEECNKILEEMGNVFRVKPVYSKGRDVMTGFRKRS